MLTRLTDANANATTFLFDSVGHDVGSIDPLLRRITFGYDDAGNKSFKWSPRGIRVTYSYDVPDQPRFWRTTPPASASAMPLTPTATRS